MTYARPLHTEVMEGARRVQEASPRHSSLAIRAILRDLRVNLLDRSEEAAS